MEEINISSMYELQEKLTQDLLNPETNDEDRKEIARELEIVTKAINSYLQTLVEQDRVLAEREKIDADVRRSEFEAETRAQQAEIELKKEIVKGGFQLGATSLGGVFMGILAKKIVDREDAGELVRSAGMSILNKFNFMK